MEEKGWMENLQFICWHNFDLDNPTLDAKKPL